MTSLHLIFPSDSIRAVIIGSTLLFFLFRFAASQSIQVDRNNLPTELLAELDDRLPLNVSNTPLKEVFRAIGTAYQINLVIDDSITQLITLRLSRIPIIDVLIFWLYYGFKLSVEGRVRQSKHCVLFF